MRSEILISLGSLFFKIETISPTSNLRKVSRVVKWLSSDEPKRKEKERLRALCVNTDGFIRYYSSIGWSITYEYNLKGKGIPSTHLEKSKFVVHSNS